MSSMGNRLECLERELNSNRFPIVRYLPAAAFTTFSHQDPTSEWLAQWVPSDLPSVCIEKHNASCHICLMDFEEPQLKQSAKEPPFRSEDNTEPLRRLACRHVFHALCIDAYLQSDESSRYSCPVCHKKVVSLTSYMEQWQIDFKTLMSVPPTDYDDIPESDPKDQETGFNDEDLGFDKDGLPILDEYTFEPNNKYLASSSSTHSFLNDAKELLERGCVLSEAVLLIEAAIQKGDIGEGGYEAWVLLGKTQVFDVRPEPGLQALAEGVRKANSAGKSAAMLHLIYFLVLCKPSIQKAYCAMLIRWLQMHFSAANIPQVHLWRPSYGAAHDRIVDIFLRVAQEQYCHGAIDRDIQVALGILFHVKEDYYDAVVCCASALAIQQTDYALRNLLANSLYFSSMREETLEVLDETLRLHPLYTDAFYTLAWHYVEQGRNKEGAEHILSALALQESSGGRGTEALWSDLSVALGRMDRNDLAAISKLEVLTPLDVYRREGFKFLDVAAYIEEQEKTVLKMKGII